MLVFIKKNFMFLITFILCVFIIVLTVVIGGSAEQLTMEKLLLTKSARVNEVISRLTYYRASELASIVLQSNGVVKGFEKTADAITDDPTILYVSLAPNGIITDIYPVSPNEALLNTNILKDGIGVQESITAKESGQLVIGGPYYIAEDEQALLARLPVYMDMPDGSKLFWGLVTVALRYPQVMDIAGLDELLLQGFGYEIYKLDGETGEKLVIAGSNGATPGFSRHIEKKVNVMHNEWYFRIYSINAWYANAYFWLLVVISVALSFLSARLQIMTTKARESSKAKSEFLAAMSHEIRTPMNAIIGMAELLSQGELTRHQREYVNDIRTSSKSLLGIINDILDHAKIESGKLSLAPTHFSFPEFLENTTSIISFTAKKKALEFILETSGEIPEFVYGDDVRLRQILINILGNAVKFTEQGFVKLSVSYSSGTACFAVADTGIGIKESDLERLYDSFEQFDSHKNKGKHGTGLGLAITKSLVDMMGGNIQVHSVYGEGTVFKISVLLPEGDADKTDAINAPGTIVAAKDARILLVDDNEVNRKVMRGLLNLHGIECETAETGAEALRLVAENDYDIVFMDHMMPEMDGVEATEHIRAKGGKYSRGKLVIIALSANVLPEARKLFDSCGMDDFIAKPVDRAVLNNMLAKWLPAEKQSVRQESTKKQAAVLTPLLVDARLIDGLNVMEGINYTGGTEEYERSLRLLRDSIPRTIAELENYLKTGDLKRFATDVHGMKGALAINGHAVLSELARELEFASKDGDFEVCARKLPEFSAQLLDFSVKLEKIFGKVEEKPKIEGGEEMLFDTLSDVENFVSLCDRENALKTLLEISDYTFGAAADEALSELVKALENFDFDTASNILQNIEI